MITTIRKVGNSAGVLIPSIMMKELNLSVGAEIDLTSENGVLTIKPKQPRRGRSELTLAWLLKDYVDPSKQRSEV